MTEPPLHTRVSRVAMTLDIKPGMVEEYTKAHANPRPQVVEALRSVGLRNLSLWVWRERMFYYAEFVPVRDETFAQAMARYAEMPGGSYPSIPDPASLDLTRRRFFSIVDDIDIPLFWTRF